MGGGVGRHSSATRPTEKTGTWRAHWAAFPPTLPSKPDTACTKAAVTMLTAAFLTCALDIIGQQAGTTAHRLRGVSVAARSLGAHGSHRLNNMVATVLCTRCCLMVASSTGRPPTSCSLHQAHTAGHKHPHRKGNRGGERGRGTGLGHTIARGSL